MWQQLFKNFFFLPEFFNDLKLPVRRRYFINYFRRFFRSLFWIIYSGYPSRKLKLIGITGTDGKTTTANLLFHILTNAGKRVSIISTIYGQIGKKTFDTGFHVTTPNAREMQQFFQKAIKDGSEYFIIEATSHGLDQYRLLGCNFKIGILTNITHEHLDYHFTFKNYLISKAKLFQKSQISILNRDDKSFGEIKKYAAGKVISYGLTKNSDFNPTNSSLKVSLIGEYNKYNFLAAIAAADSLGIDKKVISKSLNKFAGLPGRMEEIKNSKDIKIFIDFAHTPNALENALKTLREKTVGNLIAVFGSAGKRDEEKRAKMAKIGIRLANFSIITSEDPRGEWEKISTQMKEAAMKVGAKKDINFFVIEDRQRAIDFAIKVLAKKGDVVGIFGKGHEQSMNLDGKKEIPWSDLNAVYKVLNGHLKLN